jgi:hypothetical protein
MCCLNLLLLLKSWEAVFSVVPRLRDTQQRKRCSIFSRCKRYFSLIKRPDQLWRPPSRYSMSIGGSFFQVKRPERESESLGTPVVDVKRELVHP